MIDKYLVQSSLRTKDTLGTGILSSFLRLSLSRRLAIVSLLLNKEGHTACWTCPLQPSSNYLTLLKQDVNKALVGKKVEELDMDLRSRVSIIVRLARHSHVKGLASQTM